MNLLQLCQALVREGGISGTFTTAQNQTGEFNRVVNWIMIAWDELQTDHDDWDWLRSSNLLGKGASFATVAGQASYPLGTGAGTCGIDPSVFGKWDKGSFRNYSTATGFINEVILQDISYDIWRDSYMLGAQRVVQTRPVAIAVGPDKSLCIGPPSDGTYTVTGDYFTAPTFMVADTDIPIGLPVRWHMDIVYRGMMMYAGYESASEVYQRGMTGHAALFGEMESQYLPEVTGGGALA